MEKRKIKASVTIYSETIDKSRAERTTHAAASSQWTPASSGVFSNTHGLTSLSRLLSPVSKYLMHTAIIVRVLLNNAVGTPGSPLVRCCFLNLSFCFLE